MERLHRMFRLLLLSMVVIVAPLGGSLGVASAQGTPAAGDTVVSELSGMEIEVSEDFAIDDVELQEYEHGEGELVFISSDFGQFQVSFFDDTDDPETTVSLFNDGVAASADDFEIVDQGLDGDIAWSLADVTYSDADVYYYSRVTPDVVGNVDLMESFAAPQADFLDEFELAQDGILIDGFGMFDGVDVDDLDQLLAGEDSATAVAIEEDETAVPDDDTGTDTGTTTGDVFVSEITGVEIEYADPVILGDSQTYGSGANTEESVTLHSDFSNITVGFFLGEDAEASLDEFLTGFDGSAQDREEIDRGYERGVAWTYSNAVLGDGTEAVIYIQISENTSHGYLELQGVIADAQFFFEELQVAQDSVLIDGDMMLAEVDVAELEDLARGVTVDGESTPEVDDPGAGTDRDSDQTDEATSRRDRARLPVDDSNETETGGIETSTGFEEAGLVSDTEYVSPQYDTEVVWGDTWFVDLDDEDSVISDVPGDMDSLVLIWDGSDFAMLFIDISGAGGLVPDDFVDYWASDDFLADNADPNAEILLEEISDGSGAVIMRDYLSDGEEVIVAKEAIALDGGDTIAVVTLIGLPNDYGDIYGDAAADIEIDDVSAFNIFRDREVERSIGN